MGLPNLKEQIAILRQSADRFEELARDAQDDEERMAMHLVSRAVRTAAQYASAAGFASALRTRVRSFSLGA